MFGFKKSKTDPSLVDWVKVNVPEHSTPDIAQLERRLYQILFVTDEMMKCHAFNSVLGDEAIALKVGFTHEKFTMWKRPLGGASYPVVLETEFVNQPARPIMGELYAIRPGQFLEIDKHKDNGVLFERKRVNIVVPYREQIRTDKEGLLYDEYKTARTIAWMYFGIPTAHDIHEKTTSTKIFGRGIDYSPVDRYVPKNPKFWDKEYYYFAPKELKP